MGISIFLTNKYSKKNYYSFSMHNQWIQRYYKALPQESTAMILNLPALQFLTTNSFFLHYLKYFQNLSKLGYEDALKTLGLSLQLSRLNNKWKQANPFKSINKIVFSNPKNLSFSETTFYFQLVSRLAAYLDKATQNLKPQEQMFCLIQNISQFHRTFIIKNQALIAFTNFYYFFIEDVSNNLWKSIEKEYHQIQILNDSQFLQFYPSYTAFCTTKKKIPKKNKNNVFLDIDHDKNIVIEKRYQQLISRNFNTKGQEDFIQLPLRRKLLMDFECDF